MIDVVVTGSRDWPPDKAWIIWEALARIEKLHENDRQYQGFTLHHGECPFGGADLISASWAAGAGWEVKAHPPKERTPKYYAIRNREMIDLEPDYVVAFFLEGARNRGTKMTYEMATEAKLNTISVTG